MANDRLRPAGAPHGGELIRVWQRRSFRLELFDTHERDSQGKTWLACRFADLRMGLEPIFRGLEICVSPLHADDSDATVAAVLSFVCLAPGDTDAQYFAQYSRRQLEWMERYAEELAGLRFEMEEALLQAHEHGARNALWIELAGRRSPQTVFTVFDSMSGEQWQERFTDVERGATAEALAAVRERIEESASQRRQEALAEALVTCLGCSGVACQQCSHCLGRGTVAAWEVMP